MMLLERLLDELFATGHKVLVFSQFTTQLDIIEDWAVDWKGWNICRIDGHTKQEDRRSQLKDFNENKGKDAPNLFLLSTRSGGVGINLTGADTVILFDSDWNPQMDLQAVRPTVLYRQGNWATMRLTRPLFNRWTAFTDSDRQSPSWFSA